MARVFHAENVLAPPDELLEAFGKLNDPDVHHQGTVWITTEPRLPRVPIFYDPGKMTSAPLALLQHEQSGDDQTLSLDHTPDDLVEAFRGVVDMDPGPTPSGRARVASESCSSTRRTRRRGRSGTGRRTSPRATEIYQGYNGGSYWDYFSANQQQWVSTTRDAPHKWYGPACASIEAHIQDGRWADVPGWN
ncbi:MAG: hypothetical protein JST92_03175 [Deltaproteobacteria bacterium]|nr:hypothetical protein [Deltaproteobacteria bacterium]